MADIAALNVALALQQPAGLAASGGGSAALPASLLQLPSTLDHLAAPQSVQGTLGQIDLDGTITVATNVGTITLALVPPSSSSATQNAAFLSAALDKLENLAVEQKPVTLLLQAGAPPTEATLTLPALKTTAPSVTPNVDQTLATLKPVAIGDKLVLIPLATSYAEPQKISQQTALPPVTPATSQAAPASAPAAPSAPASTAATLLRPTTVANLAPESRPVQTSESPLQAAQVTASSLRSALPQTSAIALEPATLPMTLRVVTVGAAPETLSTPLPHGQTSATVTGLSTNGQALVKIGDTTYYVASDVRAPQGTRLVLAADEATPGVLPKTDAVKSDTLAELVQTLQQLEPQLAAALFSNRAKPSAMPTALLFLLNALNQGDLTQVLGKHATETLRKTGYSTLLDAFAADVREQQQDCTDPTIGPWHAYPLPMFDGAHVQMLQLMVHREPQLSERDADRVSTGTGKTRFVIALDLSALGRLQLDGLSQKKQLDLVVRSETPLPFGLADELRALYLNTLDATGMVGSLTFQTGSRGWIEPMPLTASHTASLIT
jgi:hypothetical protein